MPPSRRLHLRSALPYLWFACLFPRLLPMCCWCLVCFLSTALDHNNENNMYDGNVNHGSNDSSDSTDYDNLATVLLTMTIHIMTISISKVTATVTTIRQQVIVAICCWLLLSLLLDACSLVGVPAILPLSLLLAVLLRLGLLLLLF